MHSHTAHYVVRNIRAGGGAKEPAFVRLTQYEYVVHNARPEVVDVLQAVSS